MTDINGNKKITERLLSIIGNSKNRPFADKCGFDEKVVRNIRAGQIPGREVLDKIAATHNKSLDWILCRDKKTELETTQKTAEPQGEFNRRREDQQTNDALRQVKRFRFKQQCGSVYFDDMFDFVAEYYGEDKEGVDDFLATLMTSHGNYRTWIEEKKSEDNSGKNDEPRSLAGNDK